MKNKLSNHKDLDVWQKSIELVTQVYKISKSFPKEELYGLTSQLRRSAVSIPSNIAEGAGRNTPSEFIHFLYIALGSLSELDTQLIITANLDYCPYGDEISARVKAIKQMLNGLIRSLQKKT